MFASICFFLLSNVHMANDLGNPPDGAGRSKYGSCNKWVGANKGQKSHHKFDPNLLRLFAIFSDSTADRFRESEQACRFNLSQSLIYRKVEFSS